MRVQRSHSSKCVHFLPHKRHRETEHTCCWEFFNAVEVAGVYLRADMLIVAGKIVTICINCTPPGVVWLIRLQGPQLCIFFRGAEMSRRGGNGLRGSARVIFPTYLFVVG